VSIAYVMACLEQLMPAMRSLPNANTWPSHSRKFGRLPTMCCLSMANSLWLIRA